MRKILLLAALSLTAFASSSSARATLTTTGYYSCPQCITYADGSQCCVGCICTGRGQIVACTDVVCPIDDQS